MGPKKIVIVDKRLKKSYIVEVILTSQDMLDVIDFIIDNEMARPDHEIDLDLIQAAIETAQTLKNIDIEQRKKEADALVRKIIAEVNLLSS